jgi:hypothetical protein
MRRILTIALTGLLAAAAPMGAGAARPEKVDICHYNADLDPDAPIWELLQIKGGDKNLAAHLGHGDAFPGDPVPGTDGAFTLDATCTPAPTAPLDVCVYREQLLAEGINVGRPAELTLLLGDRLTTDVTDDQNGKAEVNTPGAYDGPGPLLVRVANTSNPFETSEVFFDGPVAFGESLTAVAEALDWSEFSATTYVHLFGPDGALLQTIKIHTSCSAPLVIGAQFGTVSLAGAVLVDADTTERYELP